MNVKKLFNKKTIKYKIIWYNFFIICIVSTLLSVFSYVTANKKVVQIAENSMKYNVSNIVYQYQMAYKEMINIVLNCTEHGKFESSHPNNEFPTSTMVSAVEDSKILNDYCAITGYGNYIAKLSVFNKDGILIQAGTSMGSIDDENRITKTDWFKKEMKKNMDYYQLDVVESPFYRDKNSIIPIVRGISSKSAGNKGWVLLCISDTLFQDILDETTNEHEIIVVTNTGKRIASGYEKEENKIENDEIIKQLLSCKDDKGLLNMKIHGKDSLLSYYKDDRSGIMVLETVDFDSLRNDKLMLIQTIVIIFSACILIGLVLSIIFSNQLKRPIDRLIRQINSISKGSFVQDRTLESEDEIGIIGKGINNMSAHIEELIEQVIEDEKEKRHLELKMLQAQINPHFLYNTLDSIKWIATMQNNSGIVKIVVALSRLLKNMAKGFNEKVTFKQELDFLKDYVTIEKIKYVELFDIIVDVDEEELYDAKIIKLTLQPLVENAIFSGIEPSGRPGKIQIHAYAEAGDFYITVRDNGVGISKEKIETILIDTDKVKGSHMSGIGMANVDKRIKLNYGENYGIVIESKLGEYTEIKIKTPLEY